MQGQRPTLPTPPPVIIILPALRAVPVIRGEKKQTKKQLSEIEGREKKIRVGNPRFHHMKTAQLYTIQWYQELDQKHPHFYLAKLLKINLPNNILKYQVLLCKTLLEALNSYSLI